MGWSNTAGSVLQAITVIITTGTPNSGIFLYSGAPATGNLIGSWTAASGTDPYGNTYPDGINVKNSSVQTTFQLDGSNGQFSVLDDTNLEFVQLNPLTGIFGIYLGDISSAGALPTTAQVNNAAAITRTNGGTHLKLNSAINLTNNGPSFLDLLSGVSGQGTGSATCPQAELISDGLSDVDALLPGSVIKTDRTNGYLPYTKQAPVLGTGWAAGSVGGGYQQLRFWRDALDNLNFQGVIHSTSNTPAATVFTLPGTSGYRPASPQRPGFLANVGGSYSMHSLQIATNGVITIDPAITLANADMYIYASVPLGNVP